MKSYHIAVLTSGLSRGSNFAAMHNWFTTNNVPVSIDFVMITRRQAPIAQKCQQLGVPVFYNQVKPGFEQRLLQQLSNCKPDLIALAGYMRKVSGTFLHQCGCPVLNIHPALLPKFGGKGMYGINVHQAVFEAKEQISGASVHLVDTNYDTGPIVLQKQVDISACTTPQQIAQQVLTIEHQLYGEAIWHYLNTH